jgi:hypothetical protein
VTVRVLTVGALGAMLAVACGDSGGKLANGGGDDGGPDGGTRYGHLPNGGNDIGTMTATW